jgi:hypothetical protein
VQGTAGGGYTDTTGGRRVHRTSAEMAGVVIEFFIRISTFFIGGFWWYSFTESTKAVAIHIHKGQTFLLPGNFWAWSFEILIFL